MQGAQNKAVAITAAAAAIFLALIAVSSVMVSAPSSESVELRSAATQVLADGLQITDVSQGDGPEPQVGDKIKVHYTGKLADGTIFDSGDISFALGRGQVIKGWDQGLKGMRQGGERKLVIPPHLAYGAAGTPGGPIPPDATLYFDVKLLKV